MGSKPRRIPRNDKPKYYHFIDSNNNDTNYQAGTNESKKTGNTEPQPPSDSDPALPVPIDLLTEKYACPDHIEKYGVCLYAARPCTQTVDCEVKTISHLVRIDAASFLFSNYLKHAALRPLAHLL
jgi:hypothetical protein